MSGIVRIYLRAGHFRGGNSLDDVLELARQGPSWFEMDFRLNSQGVLLSGHDEDTYVSAGGPLVSDITDPSEVRNLKGGQCTTLRGALEQMSIGSRIFIDLKSTCFLPLAAQAVEAAVKDIQSSGRSGDAVIMVYPRHARLSSRSAGNTPVCLKQRNATFAEDETLRFVELASELGAEYMCAPVRSSYKRFAQACLEADICPIVPIWGKDKEREFLEHLDNGVRHFICNYSQDWLDQRYADFLNAGADASCAGSVQGLAT